MSRTADTPGTPTETRFVMMTPLGERVDAGRLEKAGFVANLAKPVSRRDLSETLVGVLTGRRRRSSRSAQPAIEKVEHPDARILLAEDNLINQKVALALLKRMGLTADPVANGVEAIEALESTSYDLVLMDCQMPEMDGFEATAVIRDPGSVVRNHAIPVIALTAHAMQGARQKCLEAGMDDYLSKPIVPQALAEVLKKWLSSVRL
jgi:CheY-like chemotaxis protein